MKLTMTLFAAAFYLLCISMSASAQVPKGDYWLLGNYDSWVSLAPPLTDLTGSGGANSFVYDTVDGYYRPVLRFPLNSGLQINVNGVISSTTYTYTALVRFDQVSGRRRIGGGDPTINGGAYLVDGRIEFEPTTNTAFRQDHYVQIVVVRESNGTVRVYRDGTLRTTINDAAGSFLLSTGVVRLFQDDTTVPNEASAGSVARIRVYNTALTTTQVHLLDRVPNAIGGGDQRVLFSSSRDGNPEIYSMNSDGSNQYRLTYSDAAESGAKWSPNGLGIIYFRRETASSPYQIWIMNADGSQQFNLSNSSTNDQDPAWRPDGQKILFSRCDASFLCDLYTMNTDGTGKTALPAPLNSANDEALGSYSPDGTKIAFVCSTGGASFINQNICTANADGSNRQQLTNTSDPVLNRWPVYSPDRTKIAFERWSSSSTIASSDIYTINATDGSGLNRVTNDSFIDLSPSWLPDGQRIADSSDRDGALTEVYTMNAINGTPLTRITINSASDQISDWYRPAGEFARKLFDFDGDRKSDISIFRPASGQWYLLRSLSGLKGLSFGAPGDKMVPADYDGDGITDVAVYRPSTGIWYVFDSSIGGVSYHVFGTAEDLPTPADYDGDGKADFSVFRPSNGTWYRLNSHDNSFFGYQFGQNGDTPALGDFDGDGKADISIYRPGDGTWYRVNSGNGLLSGTQFGAVGDLITPADYDGDGKTDIAVFRPSVAAWYRLNSSTGAFTAVIFGAAADIPAPADFDGDGKTDVCVFRPSDGNWYRLNSSNGAFVTQPFGANGDLPTPAAFRY